MRPSPRGIRRWLRALARPVARLAALWPELLAAVLFLGGWTLVTWALAGLTWRVWPASYGLLCLSLVGWRLQRTVFTRGLYALSLSQTRDPESS